MATYIDGLVIEIPSRGSEQCSARLKSKIRSQLTDSHDRLLANDIIWHSSSEPESRMRSVHCTGKRQSLVTIGDFESAIRRCII